MLPDSVRNEIKAFKADLKYRLGDMVFLKSDKKRKYPMLITGFDTDPDYCTDYHVRWFNSQGGIESNSFPEECFNE